MRLVLLAIGIVTVFFLIPSSAFAGAPLLGGVQQSSSSNFRSFTAKQASFLAGLTSQHMTCGKKGSTFPVLIRGDKPITACMLKYRPGRTSPFGSLDF